MAANTFVQLGKDPGSPYGYIKIHPTTATEAVFALHGIGERGDGKGQLPYLERNGVPYVNKRKEILLSDLAIFCPQQNITSGKFYWGTLINFFLHIVKKHGFSNKIHITGLSMGAYSLTFLMDAIKKNPEALQGLEISTCLLLSGVGDWTKGNIYPPTKLWTVHGLKDKYPADFSRNLVDKYNSTIPKVPAKFDGLEFFGHDAAVWNKVYEDPNVWQWMVNS
jgi:predicted peptidase